MKKSICSVLTVILVMSLFVPVSFAGSEDYPWIVEEVEKTNAEIKALIDEALEEVEKLDENDKKFEKNLNKIIKNLKKDTDKIAAKMIKKAAKVGIEVECVYEEVEIGGRVVLIDPLRILGL